MNTLGIHQLFANGLEWTQSTVASIANTGVYVDYDGKPDQAHIGLGTTPSWGLKNIKAMTLERYIDSYVTGSDYPTNTLHFRCVINTDQPIT